MKVNGLKIEVEDRSIAYCERQPLHPEEIARFDRALPQKVTVSLDSFDGDREAFEKFCQSPAATNYQIVSPQ